MINVTGATGAELEAERDLLAAEMRKLPVKRSKAQAKLHADLNWRFNGLTAEINRRAKGGAG